MLRQTWQLEHLLLRRSASWAAATRCLALLDEQPVQSVRQQQQQQQQQQLTSSTATAASRCASDSLARARLERLPRDAASDAAGAFAAAGGFSGAGLRRLLSELAAPRWRLPEG